MGSWIFRLGTQRRALGWPGVQGSPGDIRGEHVGGAEEGTDEQAQILQTLLPHLTLNSSSSRRHQKVAEYVTPKYASLS